MVHSLSLKMENFHLSFGEYSEAGFKETAAKLVFKNKN